MNNSIRPLLTISILCVVAVFLYLKINESPPRQVADRVAPAPETTEGVPPLNAIGTGGTAIDSAGEMTDAAGTEGNAPAWQGEASQNDAGTSVNQPTTLPAIPEIPALPEVAPSAENGSPLTSDASSPQLPSNIPVATYPGTAPNAVDNADATSSQSTPGASAPVALPKNAADELASSATGQPQATDRYGNPAGGASAPSTGPLATQPGAESFATSWPAIEAALSQGELARAHQLLSPWYGKPTLTPAEKQQVETLLSQLAGTVVYSTDHQLEPAHVVQAGETLETIAAKYNVPWQLLAKVNGVASVDAVQPGQQLKVMRGPFAAVVDLAGNEVLLNLDGRYAGRFPIIVPSNIAANEGEWMVMQKIDAPNGPERSLLLRPLAPAAPGEPDGMLLGAYKRDSAGTGARGGVLGMSPADANEIADILSVGSRVVIRR